MNTRERLQKSWIIEVLSEHPEAYSESKTPAEFYSNLWEIWLKDVHVAMKDLASEAINERQ